MNGLFLEHGPFRLLTVNQTDSWTIQINPHSWHSIPAYVVYVDQPVGTGLSFATKQNYPINDDEINQDLYYFLIQFLSLHANTFLEPSTTTRGTQQRSLRRPLFFAGESHAGHSIPSIMNYIQQQNVKEDVSIYIRLSGAAIGNGWMDPLHQFPVHEPAYYMGMIGRSQMYALAEIDRSCQEQIRRGIYDADICYQALDEIRFNSQGQGSESMLSPYDTRRWEYIDSDRQFPPGHQLVESYLGGFATPSNFPELTYNTYRAVLTAIHALPTVHFGKRYKECADPPFHALAHQDGLGVTQLVSNLLNADIPLLFYNGIHDLVCHHVGNEIFLEQLDWKYQSEYNAANRFGWTSSSTGRFVGYMKHYRNLMFLKVLDAGHVVPLDLPRESLEMMQTFIFDNKSFQTYQQAIPQRTNQSSSCPSSCSSWGQGQQEQERKQQPSPKQSNACPLCPTCPAVSSTIYNQDYQSNHSHHSIMDETSFNQPFLLVLEMVRGVLVAMVAVGCVLSILATCCAFRNKAQTTKAKTTAV